MTTSYPFDIGIGDGNPQLADLSLLPQLYTYARQIRPKYWRLMAAWNYVAKAQDPGAATFDSVNNVPTTANRDWTTIDRGINDVMLTGADPLMIIGQGRPAWSGSSGGGNIFTWFFALFGIGSQSAPVTSVDYGNFVAEVVARYKPGGPGIRTDGIYASNAGRGVTHYEVWNEENSPLWGGNISPTDYVAYLKAAYTAVKAALPGSASTVVFGGMQHVGRIGGWFGNGWINAPEIDFLNSCYAIEPLLHNWYDVMAEHIYTQTDTTAYGGSTVGPAPTMTTDNFLQLVALRNLMVAKGAGSKKIWITEIGFETAQLSQALQKTYMEAAFDLLAALSYIEVVLIYNLRDSGSGNAADSNTWGMIDYQMNPKTIFAWLSTLSGTTYTASASQNLAMTAAHSAVLKRPTGHTQALALTSSMAASLKQAVGHTQSVAFTNSVSATAAYAAAHAQAATFSAAFDATLHHDDERTITQMDLLMSTAFSGTVFKITDLQSTLTLTRMVAAQYVTNAGHSMQSLALTTTVAGVRNVPAGATQSLALTTAMAAGINRIASMTQSIVMTAAFAATQIVAPPAFDTSSQFANATGGFNTSLSGSGSLTLGAAPNRAVLVYFASRTGGQDPTGQGSCSIGGSAATLQGFLKIDTESALWIYSRTGLSSGSCALACAVGNGVNTGRSLVATAVAYSGCTTITAAMGTASSGTNLTQTVSSASNERVVQGFGSEQQGTLSSYTGGTSRAVAGTGDGFTQLVVGDAVGSASTTQSITGANGSAPYAPGAMRLAA